MKLVIDLSTISISKKKIGDKEYRTAIARVPAKHKSKILWIKATKEVLENLSKNPWTLSPSYIAIIVPTSFKKEGDSLVGPENYMSELSRILGGKIRIIQDEMEIDEREEKTSVIGETMGYSIFLDASKNEEDMVRGIEVTTLETVSVACPICGQVSEYKIKSIFPEVEPSNCPNCGAMVYYELYDDVYESMLIQLCADGKCNVEKSTKGDHYQGNEEIILIRKDSNRKAVAIQIEPHKEDFSPEIYLVFVERNRRKEFIEKINDFINRNKDIVTKVELSEKEIKISLE